MVQCLVVLFAVIFALFACHRMCKMKRRPRVSPENNTAFEISMSNLPKSAKQQNGTA